MQKINVNPNELLAPDKSIRDVYIVQVYYTIAKQHGSKCLPPLIVARHALNDHLRAEQRTQHMLRLEQKLNKARTMHEEQDASRHFFPWIKAYEKFDSYLSASPFMLLDGHHRAFASILANQPLYAFELSSDADLLEYRTSAENAEVVPFHTSEPSLQTLINNAEHEILNPSWVIPTLEPSNILDRLEKYVSETNASAFIKSKYLKMPSC